MGFVCTAILEQNSFRLIVVCNLVGDFERYYADYPSRDRWLYAQQKENLERVERAMKASITEKGQSFLPPSLLASCCKPLQPMHRTEPSTYSQDLGWLKLHLVTFGSFSCSCVPLFPLNKWY